MERKVENVDVLLERRFGSDVATIQWLKSQKRRTMFTYAGFWKYFLKFMDKTGTEILKERQRQLLSRKESERRFYERKLLEFREWLKENTDLSLNGIRTCLAVVRAFFNYYYCDLKFRAEARRRLNERGRKTVDYWLTLEDIQKMAEVADIAEKYVLIVGKSLGLRASDFLRLKIGLFTSVDLDQEPPIYLGEFTTKKEKIRAHLFLDSDAVQVVKAYLSYLKAKHGELNPEKPMLEMTVDNLSLILRRLAKKAGINLGNKQLRFHCLRKFLYDALTTVCSESHAKQIIGKAIPEQAYVSPRYLAKIYKRVQPLTCYTKQVNRNHRIAELTQKIEDLERLLKLMTEIYGEEILERAKQKLGVRVARFSKAPKSVYERLKQLIEIADFK